MQPTWESEGGEARLYLGDCLEVLPTLEGGSVDAVVTDPPYFLPARHYCTRKEFPRSLSDLGILEHYFRSFCEVAAAVTSRKGCFYVFCDGQSYPAFFATAYRHFRRMVPLVWDKKVSINGYSWRHQHELILFAERDEYPAVKTGDGDVLSLRATPVNDRDHPAEKPTEILQRLITKSTGIGAVILDPFMGSGTTGVAAIQTGRRFIGIEKEPAYFEIAKTRIIAALAARQSEALLA